MAWLEIEFTATAEAVDWVCTLLAAIAYPGELAILPYSESAIASEEESDQKLNPCDQTLATLAWQFTIELLLRHDLQASNWVDQILSQLSSLQRTELIGNPTIVQQADRPEAFQTPRTLTRRIGKRLVIAHDSQIDNINAIELENNLRNPELVVQTDPDRASDIVLSLQPSLSFGSGFHPATTLSLQLLERYVTPTMKTLDLGSGSGILSVAIAKLGAQVLALDNDPVAVQATQAMADRNWVSDQITVRQGSLGQGNQLGHWLGGVVEAAVQTPDTMPTGFDLIVANLLGRIHLTLAADFRQALMADGWLVVAGFTTEYEVEVEQAFAAVGLERLDRMQFQDWVALVYRPSY